MTSNPLPMAAWWSHLVAGAALVLFALILVLALGWVESWNRYRRQRRAEQMKADFGEWHRDFLKRNGGGKN